MWNAQYLLGDGVGFPESERTHLHFNTEVDYCNIDMETQVSQDILNPEVSVGCSWSSGGYVSVSCHANYESNMVITKSVGQK